MKKLVRILAIFSFIFFTLASQVQAIEINFTNTNIILAAETELLNPADAKLRSEYGKKIDLNNANVRLFRDFRGFYPTLAKKIVDNAPYEKVDDVLDIPDLSDRQKSLLQANLDKFTVTTPADVFNEGGDRYNPGYY